jgi:hypothetical protein
MPQCTPIWHNNFFLIKEREGKKKKREKHILKGQQLESASYQYSSKLKGDGTKARFKWQSA